MKKLFLLMLAPFLFTILMCAGPRRVYVQTAPPPPKKVAVVRTNKPYPNAVWVKGHWHWNGRKYVWRKGHWQKPRKGYVWVPGHWEHNRRGWHWREGHWKRR